MQLTGPEILRRMNRKRLCNPDRKPDIIITPFDTSCLGSNSYDLHLANKLLVYQGTLPEGMKPAIEYHGPQHKYDMHDWFVRVCDFAKFMEKPWEFDPRNPKFLIDPCFSLQRPTIEITIPETGLILSPYIGYLGSTVEYTETYNLFPYIDGKSSIGRNFILNHHTAGRGDDGFCGNWTLEIRTLYPTVVYPNMRIGQIYYEKFVGRRKPYNTNPASHYNGQRGPTPAAPVRVDAIVPQHIR